MGRSTLCPPMWLLFLAVIARAQWFAPSFEKLDCNIWHAGNVLVWGDGSFGGNAHEVQDDLYAVKQVVPTKFSFGALKEDGSVVTWGFRRNGGQADGSTQTKLHSGVKQLKATNVAFAALRTANNGSIVVWGDPDGGGKLGTHVDELSLNVREIFANEHAFAAVKKDGTVVTWGAHTQGGFSEHVEPLLRGVVTIQATWGAFAALLDTGRVISWGDELCGGDNSRVRGALRTGIVKLFSTFKAFAALTSTGGVVAWGEPCCGGSAYSVGWLIWKDVETIVSNWAAFVAIKTDRSVVTWGDYQRGGDSDKVKDRLAIGVLSVTPFSGAFEAVLTDGSTVRWGDTSKDITHYTTHLGTKLTLSTTGKATTAVINSRWPECPTTTTTPPTTTTTTTSTTTTSTSTSTTSTTNSTTTGTITTTNTTSTTTTSTSTTSTTTTSTTTTDETLTTRTTTTTNNTETPTTTTTQGLSTTTYAIATTTSDDLLQTPGSTVTLTTLSSTLSPSVAIGTGVVSTTEVPPSVTTTTTTTNSALARPGNASNSSVVTAVTVKTSLSLYVSGPSDLVPSADFNAAQVAAFSWALPRAQLVDCVSIEIGNPGRRRLNETKQRSNETKEDEEEHVLKLVVWFQFMTADEATAQDLTGKIMADTKDGHGFRFEFSARLQHECNERGIDFHVLGMHALGASQRVGKLDLAGAGLLCKLPSKAAPADLPCPSACHWEPAWNLCVSNGKGGASSTTPQMAFTTNKPPVKPSPLPPVIRDSEWAVGEWGTCSSVCGAGQRQRAVLCVAETTGGVCTTATRPAELEDCQSSCTVVGALGGGVFTLIFLVCLRYMCRKRLRAAREMKLSKGKTVGKGKDGKKNAAGEPEAEDACGAAKKPGKKKGDGGKSEPFYGQVPMFPDDNDDDDDAPRSPRTPRRAVHPSDSRSPGGLPFDQVPDYFIPDEETGFDIEITDPIDSGRRGTAAHDSFVVDLDGEASEVREATRRASTMPAYEVPDRLPLPEDDDSISDASESVGSSELSSLYHQAQADLMQIPSADKPSSRNRSPRDGQEASPQRDIEQGPSSVQPPDAQANAAASSSWFSRNLGWAGGASWFQPSASSVVPSDSANLGFDDVPQNLDMPSEDTGESDTWEGLGDSISASITPESTDTIEMRERNWRQPLPLTDAGRMSYQDVPECLDVLDDDVSSLSDLSRSDSGDWSSEHTGSSEGSQHTRSIYSGSEGSRSLYSGSELHREHTGSSYSGSERTASSYNSRTGHHGSVCDDMSCDGSRGYPDDVSVDLQQIDISLGPTGSTASASASHSGGVKPAQPANAEAGDKMSFFSAIRNRLQQPAPAAPAAMPQEGQAKRSSKGRSFDSVLKMGQNISARQSRKGGPLDFSQVPDVLPDPDASSEDDDGSSMEESVIASRPLEQVMAFDEVPDSLPVSECGSDDESSYLSSEQTEQSLGFSGVPDNLSTADINLGFGDVPASLDVPDEKDSRDGSPVGRSGLVVQPDDCSDSRSQHSRSHSGHSIDSRSQRYRSNSPPYRSGHEDDRSIASKRSRSQSPPSRDGQDDDRSVASRRSRRGGHDDDRSVASRSDTGHDDRSKASSYSRSRGEEIMPRSQAREYTDRSGSIDGEEVMPRSHARESTDQSGSSYDNRSRSDHGDDMMPRSHARESTDRSGSSYDSRARSDRSYDNREATGDGGDIPDDIHPDDRSLYSDSRDGDNPLYNEPSGGSYDSYNNVERRPNAGLGTDREDSQDSEFDAKWNKRRQNPGKLSPGADQGEFELQI